MLSLFYSVATQHDTCPVCRKSLNGEDRSSQPPSESPSLSMDPRTQERWSFWDTHLCHPFGSPRLHPATHREDEKRFSLFLFSISVAVIIISVWYFFLYFLFSILMPFLLNHVCRNPYRRLNSHSRSLQDLPSSSFLFFLPNDKPASIDDQARVFSISPPQANSSPNFLEMHCCATLLWGNARLYIIHHSLVTHLKTS